MKYKIVLLLIVSIIVTVSYFYFSNQQNFDEQTKIEPAVVATTEDSLLVDNKQKSHSGESNNVRFIEKTNPWQETEKITPVMDYFDELVEAATNGDADAQYHIAIAHRYCFSIPKTEEQLNKRLLSSNTKETNYFGTIEKDNESFVQKYDWCKGFPRNQFKGRWKEMLLQAARGGNSYAKIEFLGVAFSSIDPADYISKTEEITEIKREGHNHLIDSRNMGNRNALPILGGAYEDGISVKKDLVEAFANYYAFASYSDSPDSYLFMERFERQLSNEELEQAIIRGERYAECCD